MIRRLAYPAAERSGLNRLSRRALRRRLLVLCFHGVCAEKPDVPDHAELHVPRALFRRQMVALLKHYTPISLAELRESRSDGRTLPRYPMLVTFDDGYRNVARNAVPVLRELGIPWAWFVVPGTVDSGRLLWPSELELRFGHQSDYPELKRDLRRASAAERTARLAVLEDPTWTPPRDCDHSLATWDELALIVRHGAVTLGSHGLRHHPLTTCDPDGLRAELGDSARLIESRLGIRVDAIAYPHGAFSPEVTAAAAEAGYTLGFTTVPRHSRSGDDALALPRILVGRRDEVPMLLARIAGWVEWLRGLRGGAT